MDGYEGAVATSTGRDSFGEACESIDRLRGC